MNQQTAKKIRRGIRQDNTHQLKEFTDWFSHQINGMPLRKRMKFAWSVVIGRVD